MKIKIKNGEFKKIKGNHRAVGLESCKFSAHQLGRAARLFLHSAPAYSYSISRAATEQKKKEGGSEIRRFQHPQRSNLFATTSYTGTVVVGTTVQFTR